MNNDKWIIQTFWTRPMKDIPYEADLCKLSLYYAHRNGYKVHMYCDSAALPYLEPLGYDDISTLLDEIPPSVPTSLFAAGKFWSLRDAGPGVVHIDNDVFLKYPLLDEFFHDPSIDCILQCRECYEFYRSQYEECSLTLHYFGYPSSIDVDHQGICNVGTIGFNNADLLNRYVNEYFDALAYMSVGNYESVCKVMSLEPRVDFVLEQAHIDSLIHQTNARIKFILAGGGVASRCATLLGYQHLQGSAKYLPEVRQKIAALIKKYGL